ncbi:hypothetical protein GVAV_002657 [Gurleya vavrai]
MEFYFITKRKNLEFSDVFENTYISELSVILMQKTSYFDIKIASYTYYKFFIENKEIKIESKQTRKYPFDNIQDKKLIFYIKINSICENEMLTILPNLEIEIVFAKNLKNQTKNLNNSCDVNTNNLHENKNLKLSVIFSKDLLKIIKNQNKGMIKFFKLYKQFLKINSFFLQNLTKLKNFFLFGLNTKIFDDKSINDFNFVKLTTFEAFQQYLVKKIYENYIENDIEIFSFDFCIDTYNYKNDNCYFKTYNTIKNVKLLKSFKKHEYVDQIMDSDELKYHFKIKLNDLFLIFNQRIKFFIKIYSDEITETIYLYYLERYPKTFLEYLKSIEKNDSDPFEINQTNREVIVEEIIKILDINFLFVILNNFHSYDDLLKVLVVFFVLKDQSNSELIKSESFLYVEKVVKKEILINDLESLITKKVIKILENEIISLNLNEYYNQVFNDLKLNLYKKKKLILYNISILNSITITGRLLLKNNKELII